MDSAICQNGGVRRLILMNITMGVKIGMRDTTTAMVESGLFTKKNVAIMGIISVHCSGACRFCASCSELQTAPTAANSAVYMKYPRRKNSTKYVILAIENVSRIEVHSPVAWLAMMYMRSAPAVAA